MTFYDENLIFSTTNVRYGYIKSQSLSEKLHSVRIELSQISKTNFKVYDLCSLDNEYYIIGQYEEKIVKKESPQLFDYTIDLVEPTKLLETIVLPNMTITNIGQNRKIYLYIYNAVKRYFKNEITNNIQFDSSFISQCNSVVAKENTFKGNTLREYIDFLISPLGYRCKLSFNYTARYYVLSFLDFNVRNGVVNTQYITEITGSQTAVDTVSEITSDINEVISPETKIEYHKLKSNESTFTSDNAKIILDNKPYDLSKIKVLKLGSSYQVHLYGSDSTCAFFTKTAGIYYLYGAIDIYSNNNVAMGNSAFSSSTNRLSFSSKVDISRNVVTDEVYNSLSIKNVNQYASSNWTGSWRNLFNDELYKNNTIRWNRNNNIIDGLNTFQTMKAVMTFTDKTALEFAYLNNFCYEIAKNATNISGVEYKYKATPSASSYSTAAFPVGTLDCGVFNGYRLIICPNLVNLSITGAYEWQNAAFKIEYVPYLNTNLKQRQDSYDHLVTMIDNATNASTDLLSYWKQIREKNNQLGNKALTFSGFATSENAIELGQKYTISGDGDYYVNEIEKTIKKDAVLFIGTMTKNFSNRNINAILNREKRYYALPLENESVDRKETFVLNDLPYEFSYYSRIGVSIYVNNDFKGSLPVSRVMFDDDTMLLTVAMYDNISIACEVSNTVVDGTESVYTSEYLKYVDSYGENTGMKFIFYAINETYNSDVYYDDEFINYHDADDYEHIIYEFNIGAYFLKDSRERIILSLLGKVEE